MNDFFLLEMITRQWTKLKDLGPLHPIACHSLTPIGPKQIMLLGGAEDWWGNGAYDLVMLYDAENSTWKESQRLPVEFCGEGGGLSGHKAVAVMKRNHVTKVVCVGGWVNNHKYSTQLLEFEVRT